MSCPEGRQIGAGTGGMQDRYVGDIGDYVKQAILRALMPGYHLGIAWWLYPDEAHNSDGRHIGYLSQPGLWRSYDPELFDSLAAVVAQGRRRVQALQDASILANATYCDEIIPTTGSPADRRAGRSAWFNRVRTQLADCDLVFADPDNGLETAGFSPGALVGGKCIAFAEVAALATPNRTLVIYHHQTRRKGGHIAELAHWAERLRGLGFGTVDAIRSRPYSPRAFFILDAPPPIRMRAAQLVARWQGHLSWHEDVHNPTQEDVHSPTQNEEWGCARPGFVVENQTSTTSTIRIKNKVQLNLAL